MAVIVTRKGEGQCSPLSYSGSMIHLQANNSAQVAYFTPFQARKFMAAFTIYLLVIENDATKDVTKCIMNVTIDNERYTKAALPTDNDDPLNGEVLLDESGLYTYTIYGQTSETNLDPSDTSVVGVCEMGMLRVTAEDAWNVPDISIPDNVIYYE